MFRDLIGGAVALDEKGELVYSNLRPPEPPEVESLNLMDMRPVEVTLPDGTSFTTRAGINESKGVPMYVDQNNALVPIPPNADVKEVAPTRQEPAWSRFVELGTKIRKLENVNATMTLFTKGS